MPGLSTRRPGARGQGSRDVTDRDAAFAAVRQAHDHFGRLDIVQSLSLEVAGFGVHVTLIEPAGYSTDWSGSSAKHSTELPAYGPVREQAAASRKQRFTTPGDPTATREAILTLVDSDNPPLRLFLGESPPVNSAIADS